MHRLASLKIPRLIAWFHNSPFAALSVDLRGIARFGQFSFSFLQYFQMLTVHGLSCVWAPPDIRIVVPMFFDIFVFELWFGWYLWSSFVELSVSGRNLKLSASGGNLRLSVFGRNLRFSAQKVLQLLGARLFFCSIEFLNNALIFKRCVLA